MLLGHERQRAALSELIKKSRLSHAQIFSGPEGIGKKMLALELAAKLICSKASESGSHLTCDCSNCKLLKSGNHPDVMVVESRDRENWNTEGIRKLLHTLSLKGFQASARIIIINDAEALSAQASNALLKQIEEPSKSTYFFVITENSCSLLPTIQSRCQQWYFSPLSAQVIREILSAEKFSNLTALVPLDKLTELANGSLSSLDVMVNHQELWEQITEAINQIFSGDHYRAITLAEDLKEQKEDLRQIFTLIRTYAHSQLKKAGDQITMLRWSNWIPEFIKTEDLIFRRNTNIVYSLQELFFKLSRVH